jgi:cyclophilin family peptidyl-prolyl cis-trans isomerase/HEAT repeat protein
MTFSRRTLRHGLTALGLAASLAAAGCRGDDPHRQERLQDIARWQDRRLAPADSLAQDLSSRDAFVRLAAARAAGLIGRDDVVPALENLLHDRSFAVRAEAAWSLGLLGDPRAVPALGRAAADTRPALRVAALSALAHVPNDGTALLAGTRLAAPEEAAVAWDGLRQQATRVQPDSLRAAITAGLAHSRSDVRWRVLRCAELAPDSTLTVTLAPFAHAPFIQERVHAYRALGKQHGVAALTAVLDGFESHSRLRGRDRDRAVIAGCRALGALAAPLARRGSEPDNATLAEVADVLVSAASANAPGAAETALAAMEAIVAEAPLPPQAETVESLLPAWRLRLARSAADRLADSRVGVRAAAATAWAALRGTAASDGLARALATEKTPFVAAAQLKAIARVHRAPGPLLREHTAGPLAPHALIRAAALEGLAQVVGERPAALPPDLGPAGVAALLLVATRDSSFVVRTTAADLLGNFPGDETLAGLLRTWDEAREPGQADIRRGVLSGLTRLLKTPAPAPGQVATAKPAPVPAAAAGMPPTAPAPARWQPDAGLKARTVQLLSAAFADPDLRLRREGRSLALAAGLVATPLVPTEASLKATLPAVVRDPAQPEPALPSRAPDLRCDTPRGSFRIRLHADVAPNTCALFAALAGRGWFDGQTFHRVVPDFVAQGGDPDGTGWGGPGYFIRSEANRRPYKRGAVGIADDGLDTGSSQFFVTLSEQPHLNGRYTLFGDVVEGMDVVDRLQLGDTFSFSLAP